MVTTTIDALDEQPDDRDGVTPGGWVRDSREDLRAAVGAAAFSTPDLRERVWTRIVTQIENDQALESDAMAQTACVFDATAMRTGSRAIVGRRPRYTSHARKLGVHPPSYRAMRLAVANQGPRAIALAKKGIRQ